jgi:SAM-dependent methyltransferase
MRREVNPFEQKKIAEEWIQAVESGKAGSARPKEIYPRIKKWAAKLPPGVVVDIGAGQGDMAKLFTKKSHYLGIEPSKFLVARATELHANTHVEFQVGNAYETGIPAGDVVAVASVAVWFHLKDLRRAAKELARILQPGGAFYIVTANPTLYSVWEKFFAQNGKYQKKGKILSGAIGSSEWKLSHNIFYRHTLTSITTTLKKAGLNITSLETFGYTKQHGDQGIWLGIQGKRV